MEWSPATFDNNSVLFIASIICVMPYLSQHTIQNPAQYCFESLFWGFIPSPLILRRRYLKARPLLGPSKQVTIKSVAKNASAPARKVLILDTALLICWLPGFLSYNRDQIFNYCICISKFSTFCIFHFLLCNWGSNFCKVCECVMVRFNKAPFCAQLCPMNCCNWSYTDYFLSCC